MLLGVGFANLWMLGFALAAGIPILIHLLTRRRQTHVPWAAMKLLQQVIERESKRVRFEQLLLLALRVLILLLFAFALARPFLEQAAGESARDRAPKLWIIGIDTSYSMAYRAQDQSYFQEAKERALSIVEQSIEGDAFALIELNSPAVPIILRPTFDRERTLAEIRNRRVNDMGSDIQGGLSLARQIAIESQRLPDMPSQVHTLFLSDLGVDAWETVIEGDSASIRELGRVSAFEVLPLAEQRRSNLAITKVQPSSYGPLLNQAITVSVQVNRYGQVDLNDAKVEFAVDDQTLDAQQLDFDGQDSLALSFSYTPRSIGRKQLRVKLASRDGLVADDVRNCIVDVRQRLRVLCIDERPDASRLLRLSLQAGAISAKSLEIQTCSSLDFEQWDLEGINVILANDPSSFSEREFARLTDFVSAGGALFLGLGPSANPDLWNAPDTVEFLGFQLDTASEEDLWSIDPLDYQSPVTSIFAGFPDSGLITTPIFRYWRVTDTTPSLRHDLDLTNGDPFLVRNAFGGGQVASLLSAPASTLPRQSQSGWNSMAAWPSFVPLMQRLLFQLVDAQHDKHTLSTGEILSGKAPGREASVVRIANPQGDISALTAEQANDSLDYKWLYASTDRAGIYTATYADSSSETFAMNLVPSQSSLETVPLGQVLSIQADNEAGNDSNTNPDPSAQGFALARALLFGLIGLLIAESILAWRIGKRIG